MAFVLKLCPGSDSLCTKCCAERGRAEEETWLLCFFSAEKGGLSISTLPVWPSCQPEPHFVLSRLLSSGHLTLRPVIPWAPLSPVCAPWFCDGALLSSSPSSSSGHQVSPGSGDVSLHTVTSRLSRPHFTSVITVSCWHVLSAHPLLVLQSTV